MVNKQRSQNKWLITNFIHSQSQANSYISDSKATNNMKVELGEQTLGANNNMEKEQRHKCMLPFQKASWCCMLKL